MMSQNDITAEKDEKIEEKDELCLYIESSNDRAYVLHLGKVQDDDRQINILCESTIAEDELLKVKSKSKLISYKGSKYDKQVHIDIDSVAVNTKDGNKCVTIELKDDEKNSEGSKLDSSSKVPTEKIKYEEDNGYFILKSSTGEKNETYWITIVYGSYKGSLQIESVPQELIYDVVLDFGSEASQMLIQNRNYQNPTKPVILFSNIAKHFYGILSTNNNEYDQQEESDERLFRSVFFMKKDESNKNVSVKQIVSPPSKESSKDYILFVSKREENDNGKNDERNKGEKIPNVKISYLSGGWDLPVPIRDIHGAIIMRFIHEAMASIAEERQHAVAENADGGPGQPIAVSVTLLIPNVMSQHEVSSLVKRIQRYVSQTEFRNLLPQGLRCSIIEIRTCSESDAALKNWVYMQKDSFRPGKYLIIDIGKGTTDFSIVEAKNAQKGESIFRTGFVGAGNAISYAIFNNYITQLTLVPNNSSELRERREMLMKRMLSAGPEDLYRLEQVIEKKKREETNQRKKIELERIDDYQTVEVKDIINRIDESPSIDDGFGLVSDTISRIILEILKRITGLEINFVVLCGRAFLYKPLREEMVRWLTTLSHSPRFSLFHQNKLFKREIKKENIFFNEDIAKNGCLNCTIDKMKISKSSNMVGFPIIVDRSKVEKDLSEARKAIEHINADKELRNNREKQLEYMRGVLSKAGFGKAFSEGLKAIGLIDTNDSGDESTKSTMKIMNGEFSVTTYGDNTGIYISDNLYVPVEKEVKDNQKYDIFFDGEEFWLREEKSCIKLRRSSSVSEESQLEKESLFPYIRIKDITLYDPKARKK